MFQTSRKMMSRPSVLARVQDWKNPDSYDFQPWNGLTRTCLLLIPKIFCSAKGFWLQGKIGHRTSIKFAPNKNDELAVFICSQNFLPLFEFENSSVSSFYQEKVKCYVLNFKMQYCVLMIYCVLNNNAFKLFLKGHIYG